MKIEFIISKTENQFFFLSNLSKWHFSCRPDYNAEWLAPKQLLLEEVKLLHAFGEVLVTHGYEYKKGKNQYIGQSFYIPPERGKWNSVRSQLSLPEYNLVKKCFMLFSERFGKTWDPSLLRKWRSVFKKEIKKPNVKELFSRIEKFYGVSLPQTLRVHLIASPSKTRSVAGSANVGSRDIVLEVPIFNVTQWNIEFGISILAHELIHTLIERSPKILSLIAVKNKNKNIFNRNKVETLKELVGELCAPFGYPCYKAFSSFEPISDVLLPRIINTDTKSFEYVVKRIVWGMYPIVGGYIKKDMVIDRFIVQKLTTSLQEVLKP